ncbi:MAG: diguanylate cyclase, partial [Gammaproteobacteria bacterium]|nr:diguanylate cyclase [Gammaproteobacteria bacterium]
MDVSLCERCGLDANAIAERLSLVDLDTTGMDAQGRALQEYVIRPNVDAIVDRLYGSLVRIEDFGRIVDEPSTAARVRESQKHYLLGLGVDFQRPGYFEERLRIGSVHQRVGVPQSLYQCACQVLQSLLIEYIPQEIRSDEPAFSKMLLFILKIMALDMSLAVESYCAARMSGLTESLESERGESERLRELAVTDWLTSLHNHSYSRRCLSAALERAKTEGSPLCVIMADLDHFKAINDAHGHVVGDGVLRSAAGRMICGSRADDESCRYGGEEFLFILQNTGIAEG